MVAASSPLTVGPGLTAQLDVDGARAVLRLQGEVDLAVADALEQLVADVTSFATKVDLDLGGVSFIDPRGARVLVSMTPDDGAVVITALSPPVRRVLGITYPEHPLGPGCPDGDEPSRAIGAHSPARTLPGIRRDRPRAAVHPNGRLPMTDPHADTGSAEAAHSHPHEHDGTTHAHEHASHDHEHVEHAHVHEHVAAAGTTEHEHAHAHDPAVAETHEHTH